MMYEVEVYVGDPYPQDLSMLDNHLSAEAMEYYEERKMSINLTRIWQLGSEEYPRFLYYLMRVIIHEFLHLFFYDNKMNKENVEEKVYRLTHRVSPSPERVYYAHAICLYGTEGEKKELVLIRERFKDALIINPVNYRGRSMGFYLRLVEKCHIVVFSCLLGKVTAGVGKEVNYALKKGKDVYMLNGASLFPIKSPVKFISRQDTRKLYREWLQQHRSV